MSGPEGPQGPAGTNAPGNACWDLNGNGVGDPAEDINGDSFVDVQDCQGPTGPQGPTGAEGPQGLQGAGVQNQFGSFAAATNSTLDTNVRFIGGTQSVTVPAGRTYKVMAVTTRAFNKTNNINTAVLNVDVGFATSATATGTGITQSDTTASPSTINSGVTGLVLAVTAGNGSPTIVPCTVPVTATAVLTLTGGVSGTTYHFGMIGNVTVSGGWSTGKGNMSVAVLTD